MVRLALLVTEEKASRIVSSYISSTKYECVCVMQASPWRKSCQGELDKQCVYIYILEGLYLVCEQSSIRAEKRVFFPHI